MKQQQLLQHTDKINNLLARYGVKFGIYKNNTFKEQLFPFDAIPRIIEHDEFEMLEKGLKQRVTALNLFLKDIYSKKQIVKDNVIPEDFIFASSGYMAECEGVLPIKGIYSHISGIDLVKGKDNEWYILDQGEIVPRKADLRAFVLMADEPLVWKSGLTRFSRNPDSFIVNPLIYRMCMTQRKILLPDIRLMKKPQILSSAI